MERYRGMDRAALDIAYSNRSVVPDWQGYLDRWAGASREVYAGATARDLRYGAGARQRLDLFLVDDLRAPTCLFLHGGYWQWNDKEGQAMVANGLLARGINAAVGEYSLAPAASMTQIGQEARGQIAWLSGELDRRGRNGADLYLAGISTGAHLMALGLGLPAVKGALLISGIYDLEPIRISSLNAAIGMDWAEARRWSPLHDVPARTAPLILTHGARELPEIQRQSADYHAVLSSLGRTVDLRPVPDRDHFSVLESLSDAGGLLSSMLADLVRGTR